MYKCNLCIAIIDYEDGCEIDQKLLSICEHHSDTNKTVEVRNSQSEAIDAH